MDAPRTVATEVDGDLRGRGTWTLTAIDGGTHVRFDWQVHADRKLLKVLRPLLRWNHNWAIARAQEGLEPYARRRTVAAVPAAAGPAGVPARISAPAPARAARRPASTSSAGG